MSPKLCTETFDEVIASAVVKRHINWDILIDPLKWDRLDWVEREHVAIVYSVCGWEGQPVVLRDMRDHGELGRYSPTRGWEPTD